MKGFLKSLGIKEKQAQAAEDLYVSQPSLRKSLYKALSEIPLSNFKETQEAYNGQDQEIENPKKLLVCDLGKSIGNIFSIICLKFSGASEEDEPLIAANFLLRGCRDKDVLPLISRDLDLTFCAKTFTALCLFLPAMNKRTERWGCPKPDFYRKSAQSLLSTKSPAHKALSHHHRGWENFIFEQFSTQAI